MVGPSGSGKTTLLHLLAGILAPAKGSVVIDDVEVAELGREDRQDFRALSVGLVFQEFELLEYLTVPENILLPYRVSPALTLDDEAGQRAMELIGQVGLAGKKNSYPGQLSQGERQRVAVCRSLVTLPKVLFGDEPTANLDIDNRDHIMDTLLRYSEEHGAPLVVVTHDHELQGRFETVLDVRKLAP
jgi:putative ABC transport system ATP-binding protein